MNNKMRKRGRERQKLKKNCLAWTNALAYPFRIFYEDEKKFYKIGTWWAIL